MLVRCGEDDDGCSAAMISAERGGDGLECRCEIDVLLWSSTITSPSWLGASALACRMVRRGTRNSGARLVPDDAGCCAGGDCAPPIGDDCADVGDGDVGAVVSFVKNEKRSRHASRRHVDVGGLSALLVAIVAGHGLLAVCAAR